MEEKEDKGQKLADEATQDAIIYIAKLQKTIKENKTLLKKKDKDIETLKLEKGEVEKERDKEKRQNKILRDKIKTIESKRDGNAELLRNVIMEVDMQIR